MALTDHRHRLEQARKPGFGIGLLKGMAVLLKHLFKRNTVIQYPDEKQDLSPRTRGVIALKEENCTVCLLCGRECPDWCIYIDSHKETLPPKREGGRPRKRNVLDRFAIDYALCMYCGICVEVCPYDALFWSREFEYAEYDIRELTHEKERLSDWMTTVLPPPPLEEGAQLPGQPVADTTPTTASTGARPATATSSAAETRTEQAAVAPKAGTVAPEAARPTDSLPEDEQKAEAETVPEPKPAAMAADTRELGQPGTPGTDEKVAPAPAEGAEGDAKVEPAATVEQTTPEAATAQREAADKGEPTAPAEPQEDPEEVYRRVLEEQRALGSSPQVAEARAKVARVRAQRGLRAATGATRAPESETVPTPDAERPTEPEPSGAPHAETPRPDPGPIASEGPER